MSIIYKFILSIFFIALLITLYLHREALSKESGAFVTSEQCKECHQSHYKSWKKTLHSKIFKVAEHQEEILGDFDSNNSLVHFKRSDIEFVIGSKWEQVYVRKIAGEYYPLTAKWLVTTQQWVPYKVDNWQETPLSTQCNGCHTTGFNSENYEFSEFGVGCEACHGTGHEHVQNKLKLSAAECSICHNLFMGSQAEERKKDIIVSYKSAVCGQCHSRGAQAVDNEHMKIEFNFPLEYIPGNEIDKAFKPLTAKQDKKGQYWWGNGISKNRHQEYADFARSKHSKSLKNLKEKRGKCDREPEDSCMQCHSSDYIMADKAHKPSLSEAKEGLTCIICHESHGMDKNHIRGNSGAHKCEQCHADALSRTTAKSGKPHYPCPVEKIHCADCHMPRIITTGGAFSLRSHAFMIIPPEATEKYQMPNSCQNGGCHDVKDLQWAKKAFNDYYPQQSVQPQGNLQ